MHFAYSETLHYILATLDLVGSQMKFGPFSEAPDKISEMRPFSEAPDKYFMHFVGSVILISYSSGPTPTYAVASHSGGANEVRPIFGGT